MTKIVVCSGEPSGDAMVRELVPALRGRFGPDLRLRVLTSSPIAEVEEHEILCDAPEPVLGDSVAGAQRWRPVLKKVWEIMAADPPDLFIAIAHHGFNFILAAELAALEGAGTRALMVAPPEVWAWDVRLWMRTLGPPLRLFAKQNQSVPWILQAMLNRGRSTLQLFDALACLFEQNLAAYRHLAQKHASDAHIVRVGHEFARYGDAALQESLREKGRAMRESLASLPEDLLIGLFPGSREAEVAHMLPIMLEGVARLRERFGERLKLVAAASDDRRAMQIRQILEERTQADSTAPPTLVTGQAEEVLSAIDFGLMCSGTVTLLAASLGRPGIVVYDRGWGLTRTLLAKLLLRRGRVSAERNADEVAFALPSAVVGERVFRELAMRQVQPENVARAMAELIEDEGAGERMRELQQRLLERLCPSPPEHGYGRATDSPMQRVAELGAWLLTGSAERA